MQKSSIHYARNPQWKLPSRKKFKNDCVKRSDGKPGRFRRRLERRRKKKKAKKRHAVGGKLSKETSRRWTRWEIMHGQGGRKREKDPGRCARFTWLRCTRMHLQPPIHSRDDGGCSDPLPSPGINGTPPTHGILIEFFELFEHEEDHWLATSLFQRRTPFGVSLSLLPVGKKLERTRSQRFVISLFLSLSLVNI